MKDQNSEPFSDQQPMKKAGKESKGKLVWRGFDRGYVEVGKKKKKVKMDIEDPCTLPLWRRIVYLGILWGLWACSLYWFLYMSWGSFLIPFAISYFLYGKLVKKNKLSWFPWQRSLASWLHYSVFYDIFINKVGVSQKILGYRFFGCMFLAFGMLFLVIILKDPVLDLTEMVHTKGTFENYKWVSGDRSCGNVILTFIQENGEIANFWYRKLNKSQSEGLYKNKGDEYEIWGAPNTYSLFPECRKYLQLYQIYGEGFQVVYNKKYGESGDFIFLSIATLLFSCSGLCFLLLIVNYKKG